MGISNDDGHKHVSISEATGREEYREAGESERERFFAKWIDSRIIVAANRKNSAADRFRVCRTNQSQVSGKAGLARFVNPFHIRPHGVLASAFSRIDRPTINLEIRSTPRLETITHGHRKRRLEESPKNENFLSQTFMVPFTRANTGLWLSR